MTSVLEITEELWQRIAPLLPPEPPANGRSVLMSEVASQLLDPPGWLSAGLGHRAGKVPLGVRRRHGGRTLVGGVVC